MRRRWEFDFTWPSTDIWLTWISRLGPAWPGLHEVGNEAEDLHFHGGRYGILARKPSPAWQFTLIDSTFDGQREAAIRENEAGLTLVHDEFRNVPTAIAIDPHYSDQLWVKDARFENISGPAILIGNENSRMTQINLEGIVCRQVPVFARFRESGRQFAGVGEIYQVKVLSHGLTLPALGASGRNQDHLRCRGAEDACRRQRRTRSGGCLRWRRGSTCEAWARKATARPTKRRSFRRRSRSTVCSTFLRGAMWSATRSRLRPDSVLIGLHPDQTQFDILDSTPAFQGPGAPRPLLEAPRGGDNIVTGIGLYTGGINTRAVGAMWMAGKDSLMDDVRFLGGHGTIGPDGKRVSPYSAEPGVGSGSAPAVGLAVSQPVDYARRRRHVRQYLDAGHVRAGGPVCLRHDALPAASISCRASIMCGPRSSSTRWLTGNSTLCRPRVSERKVRPRLSMEISRSKNITIANYHGYRVVRSYHPVAYAIRVCESSDIRFRNVHVDSNSAMAHVTKRGAGRLQGRARSLTKTALSMRRWARR